MKIESRMCHVVSKITLWFWKKGIINIEKMCQD
jgi:hypothetical protein